MKEKDKIKNLKKVTTELADNLELAHGVRTCKTCGHTPEKMYIAVEQLLLERDQEIIEMIEGMRKELPELSENFKKLGIGWNPTSWSEAGGEETTGYNQALDDLLTKLKDK